MEGKGSFSAFLAGLGIGVGIGMLFAPKTGAETRQQIKTKAGEGKEYLKQRGGELKDQANDLIEKGREALSKQRDNLADAMEAGKQAYRDTVTGKTPPPTPSEGTNL